MTALPQILASGSPRFHSHHLAQQLASRGAAIAWGDTCKVDTQDIGKAVAGVSGDFAIGLTDSHGRTILAVDRFAIQTLCYRIDDGRLQFAAQADALADANTEIDPQAIFDYLFFHTIPSPRTIFKGIFRLPPAHYAVFESGRLTVAPYWVPAFEDGSKATFSNLKEEFLALLHQCVRDQLDGSKPACFLSGGTDSSTVAGFIGAASGQPAATYSIGFDAAGYDEMEYARIAAKRFNTAHHEHYLTPDDLIRSIETVATHYDQPFGNSSSLPAYYCAAMAQSDGVTRLLAGDGGDELFGGNSRYAKSRIFNGYSALPLALRSRVMEPVLGLTAINKLPLIRKAASYVEQGRVPMPARLNMYNLINRLGVANILTADFLAHIDIGGPPAHQLQSWQQSDATHALNRHLAFDWRYTLAENDLPKVCQTSRLAGIKVGFPFLDQRLVDFSLRLPPHYKLKGLKLRWFFKEALRGFLPDEIIKKPKQGFGLPFGIWTTRNTGLHKLAAESLNSLGTRGVVRGDFIQTLLTQRLPEHPAYYGEMVWILMMLEQWLRRHAPTFRVQA